VDAVDGAFMSWRDRQYDDDPNRSFGRPGGDWQGVRPTFDNPMTWSVPLMRAWEIAVRVHLIFLIYIVIQLARSMKPGAFRIAVVEMAALFGIVLLHEFGHCFACRRVGGEANEILMWPLGGLAYCLPPHRWRAHLVTVLGGPAVNVLIFVPMGVALAVITGTFWGIAIPNPLDPFSVTALDDLTVGLRQPWWLFAMFVVHVVNMMLLLFNLLPIFPLDGGRIVQSLLWPRFGYVDAMRYSVYVGYIGAIGLGIFGAVTQAWMVVAIAIFGGVTCYITLKQLRFTESFMQGEDDLFAAARWTEDEIRGEGEPPPEPRRASRSGGGGPSGASETPARASTATSGEDSGELDAILDKIAREGMDSLSAGERRILQQATERKRRGD
jgi:Zn-dependent protease